MKIVAKLENSLDSNKVTLKTNEIVQELSIPNKSSGFGSAINGGEFLMLSLATCFCNDIYREAKKKGIHVTKVFVEVSGEFAAEGESGFNIIYSSKLEGDASDEELKKLIAHTDKVAEIQNTLRTGVTVTLMQNNKTLPPSTI